MPNVSVTGPRVDSGAMEEQDRIMKRTRAAPVHAELGGDLTPSFKLGFNNI
jgi:hypothetical protein